MGIVVHAIFEWFALIFFIGGLSVVANQGRLSSDFQVSPYQSHYLFKKKDSYQCASMEKADKRHLQALLGHKHFFSNTQNDQIQQR